MNKTAYFVRHGESLANADVPVPDPASIPLTDQGIRQAAELAEWFPEAPDLIVHSPYSRTLETASPIIARFPSARIEEWPIHEFTYLDTLACANTHLSERLPRIRAYWDRLDPSYVDGHGAESFSEMLGRVRCVLAKVEAAESTKIVVFCHGQIMHALSLLERFPDADDHSIMTKFHEEKPKRDIRNTEVWMTRMEGNARSPFEKKYVPKP